MYTTKIYIYIYLKKKKKKKKRMNTTQIWQVYHKLHVKSIFSPLNKLLLSWP